MSLPTHIQQLITPQQAWHYKIVPEKFEENTLFLLADEDSFDNTTENELELILGYNIDIKKIPNSEINSLLSKYYRRDQTFAKKSVTTYNGKSDDFLQNIISEAKTIGSSDIHIEAFEDRCRIRFRIDGMLVERYIVEKSDYPYMVNKIKIMSNLDIAEKRLPQDGRIFFQYLDKKFDIRVSVLPTLHGEKIVLRILSNDAGNIDLEKVGFSDFDLANYKEGIKKPHGILLISGPTGSGKTTTLYATLKLLNKPTRNILTIEDPIEYTLEGINQVQLKESIGLNFASALRTFLRQDPDIIMLGEIRDAETASMAIRAALTGHLVLSTIHTNSAWGTVSRLIDMGIPPFLIANTLNTSVAQRLVRLLCTHCKKQELLNPNLLPKTFKPYRQLTHHYVPVGCDSCYHTGYKGRKAIYEVIPIEYEFSEKIKANQSDVSEIMKNKNLKSLSENAFEQLEQGITSLEEVYSILLG